MRALMRDRRALARDVVLFLGFAAAGWYYAGRLQASGDEPHYLLMAQSLWQERDLDLRDNYARQDFLDYTPGPLQPHYAAPRKDGRPYPAHAPGLPALLAPVYALGGRRACLLALAALAAWLAREVRALAHQTTGSEAAARFAWLAAAGPPVFCYSFHVYTEVPSALALALSLRLLLAGPSSAAAAAAALAAAALPWLHVKMALAAAALGALALVRLRGKPLAVFVALAGVAASAYLLYHQAVFGHPTPLAIYGGIPSDVVSSSPLRALAGLFLDRSFGLLPYAPVFLLGVLGAAALCRRPAGEWLPHVAVALGVLLPALAWRMWWGGLCPPARFLVPLVPFLAVASACAVADGRGVLVRGRWFLLAAGWLLALFLIWRPEDRLLLNRADQPTRLWEYTLPEVGRWLPSLASTQGRDLVLAVAWLIALAGVMLLEARGGDRAPRRG
jgi:hypothetical protein